MIKRTLGFVATVCVAAGLLQTLGSATALAQRGIEKTGPNALHIGARSK